MKTKTKLSIIIPVFNEEKRIFHLQEIIEYFSKQKYLTETIVVNDGSQDETLGELEKIKAKHPIKIISYQENRGKGYAIKVGMVEATGDYNLFTDIDLSTPISEIEKFIPYFGKYDVLIGTRRSKEANVVIHQSKIREFLGQGFTIMSRTILNTNVSDFTCGFKCFSQLAAKKIFNNLTIDRWGFDTEVIFLAKKFKYSLKEIPVTWKNDFKTKVKFPQDIINSLKELGTIIVNDRIKKIYH
jgi:glycosyltransferase involved in cell wall biosynthesis